MPPVVLAVLWLFGVASTYALAGSVLLRGAATASVILRARIISPGPIRGRVS